MNGELGVRGVTVVGVEARPVESCAATGAAAARSISNARMNRNPEVRRKLVKTAPIVQKQRPNSTPAKGGYGIRRSEKLANMKRSTVTGNTPSHLGMLAVISGSTLPTWLVTGNCLLSIVSVG